MLNRDSVFGPICVQSEDQCLLFPISSTTAREVDMAKNSSFGILTCSGTVLGCSKF